MDFYERQRTVRTSSAKLVVLFVVAVVLMVAVIDAVVLLALAGSEEPMSTGQLVGVGLVVAAAVIGMITVVSLFRVASLRSGGGAGVARQLGAVPLEELPSTPDLVRYRNVVEEVAIASATPVPQLFVMTEEAGINAFAAGSTPADAAVAVTRGTLERLNRDELQAVIGHEFSHIVNGDMRLSMRLIGVLAGITVLGVIGRILLYSGGGRRNSSGAAILAAGLVAMIVGFVGVFFARLIKAAISRQREFLADASAVQYTRQTEGLAGALKKIGGLEAGSKLHNGRVEDVSHMLFGEGLGFSSMFATHPPLIERIRHLDPSFDADQLAQLQQEWRRTPPNGLAEDAALGLTGPGEQPAAGARPRREPVPVSPGEVGAAVGAPSEESYRASAELIRAIPEPLVDAAHRPDLVLGLVHGLLISPDPDVRRAQYDVVAAGHGPEVAEQALQAAAAVAQVDAATRLPLAELAFPALRSHGPDEIRTTIGVVGDLIRADAQVSVFEYSLGTLLWTQMSEVVTGAPPWRAARRRLADVRDPAVRLLSAVAAAGHGDEEARVAAFRAGADVLFPGAAPAYAPPRQLPELDAGWGELDGLEGVEKARLVEAIVATVHADRTVRTEERELVRTVCGVLHCPIPPRF